MIGHDTTGQSTDWLFWFFLLLLFGLWVFENKRPFIRQRIEILKNSYFINLITFLFNDISLSLLSIPSLYFIAQQFSGDGLLGFMPESYFKYFFTFFLLDFTLYAWHRLMHHFDKLWIFHSLHHSDRSVNVTTGLRFHIGEVFLEALVRVAFIGIIGVSANLVLIYQSVIMLFVLFHHANISVPYEKLISKLFIVPSLHRLHHSTIRAEHDHNYGSVFSVWDRLFGTLSYQQPSAIGLNNIAEINIGEWMKSLQKYFG